MWPTVSCCIAAVALWIPDLFISIFHTDVLWGNLFPAFCLFHHGLCIHQPKAIQVTDCKNMYNLTVQQKNNNMYTDLELLRRPKLPFQS